MPPRLIQIAVLTALLGLAAAPTSAQQPDQAPPSRITTRTPPATGTWSWTSDANVFFGYNYQQRKFADFSAWESQNWFMLGGNRAVGAGRLAVEGMLSLEPFTMKAQGSPQLFQTGESYQQTPNVNYQHPHDLLMELGATYRLERPPRALRVRRGPRRVADAGADAVHAPRIGAQQPAGAARASQPRLDAHHARACSAFGVEPARCRSRPRRFAAPSRTKTG